MKVNSLILAVLFLLALLSVAYGESQQPLKITYNVGVAPLKFTDDNGNNTGLLFDSWKRISERIGKDVEFIKAENFADSLENVKTGKVDFHLGLFKTAEREKTLLYSEPILPVDYYIFTSPQLSAVNKLSDLNGIIIGLTEGGFTEKYLKNRVPENMLRIYPTYKDLFDAATKGEIKAFVAQEFALLYYLNIRQLANTFHYKSEVPLYSQTYYTAISKDNLNAGNLISQINKAIDSVTIEERTQFQTKWFKTRTAQIPENFADKLNTEQLEYLKEKAIITVHNDQDWDPINFNEDGVPKGVTIDYLRLLGKKSGIDFRFVGGNDWNTASEMVRGGELDLICNIVKTPEREREFNFTSNPYISIEPKLYGRKGIVPISNINDLFGRKIAIPKGFMHKEVFDNYKEIEIVEVTDSTDAIFALSKGRVDVILEQEVVLNHITRKLNITNLVHAGNLNLPGMELIYAYCATAKENEVLSSIIDLASKQISNYEIEELGQKWHLAEGALIYQTDDNTLDELSLVALSNKEKEWLQNHKKVKVWGGVGAWPPIYNFKDGKPAGLAIDYSIYIFNELGIEVEFISIPWREGLFKDRDDGEIDLFPAIAYTEERSEFLNFTSPHLSYPFVIFNRKNYPLVSSLADLNGKTIAVAKGFVATRFLEQEKTNFKLLYLDTPQKALEAVSIGNADAYVGNLATGSYLIDDLGLTNLKVASPTKFELYELGYAVRKDWPELASIINKFLFSMSEEAHAELRQKTFSIRYDHGVDKLYVLKIVLITIGVGAIIVLYVLYWNRKMAFEISQRKIIESELRKLSEAIKQNPVAVVIFNRAGKIEYVNPEFSKATGVTEQESKGKDFYFLIPEEGREPLIKQVWEALDNGKIWRGETCSIVKDNQELWGAVSVSPIYDDTQKITHFVAVHEDITERRSMLEQLIEAKDVAESATQAKSNFLANMSHEIRTPMNAVMGLTHLALQTKLDAKQLNFLTKIDSSAKALLRIINDILDFSKIEAGKLEIEKIDFYLDAVLEELGSLLVVDVENKGLELLFHVEPDVPMWLIGDPLRLNQILLNLIGNSVKFTDYGEIVVKVDCLESNADTSLLKFTISDTGIGITEDQQKKLFQSFTQADTSTTRRFGGTGLGLAICSSLVNLMDGDIGVESRGSEGSTFWFTARLGVSTHKVQLPKLFADDFQGMRVLVVDDNRTSRNILNGFLTNMGCDVDTASSGIDALEKIESKAEGNSSYELVLMDWKMPSMDGIETTMKIKEAESKAKMPVVIMVTAHGREEVRGKAQEAGVAGFLVKPVNQSVLFNTILEVFGKTTVKGISSQVSEAVQMEIEQIPDTKILVVEDNRINQEVIINLLENRGAIVTIANNGKEAIDQVSENNFDLILMDIQMPEMDGFEATHRIKSIERCKDIPVLAMTAHAMAGDREKSLQAGMSDHINKPIDPEQLFSTLARWIEPYRVKNDEFSYEPLYIDEIPTGGLLIQGLDVKDGLTKVNGDITLYLKLLRLFYEEYSDALERLRNTSHKEVRHLIHTLKSVSGNLGANEVSFIAGQLEESIANDKSFDLLAEIESLEVAFGSLLSSIKLFLDSQTITSGNKVGEDSLNVTLNHMLFLLEDDYAEASEFVFELVESLKGLVELNETDILVSAINEFNIENAKEQLKKIAASLNITLEDR